jgi:hypothetical protein
VDRVAAPMARPVPARSVVSRPGAGVGPPMHARGAEPNVQMVGVSRPVPGEARPQKCGIVEEDQADVVMGCSVQGLDERDGPGAVIELRGPRGATPALFAVAANRPNIHVHSDAMAEMRPEGTPALETDIEHGHLSVVGSLEQLGRHVELCNQLKLSPSVRKRHHRADVSRRHDGGPPSRPSRASLLPSGRRHGPASGETELRIVSGNGRLPSSGFVRSRS